MKILSSKSRGAGRKGFILQVHELIRNYHPDNLVVMETKINSTKANYIIKKFNYAYFVEIPPKGLARGLCIIWENSPDFVIDILFTLVRFIYCSIRDNVKKISWLGTFIYGVPHHHLQKQLR